MKNKRHIRFSDYNYPPPNVLLRGKQMDVILSAAQRPRRDMRLSSQIRVQMAYLGKAYWAAGIALCALMLLGVYIAGQHESMAMLIALSSAVGPGFCALAAPVLCRSHMHGMWELEESALHNVPRLVSIRMLITTLVFVPVMGLMLAASFSRSLLLIAALLVPFLLACALNYALLGRLRGYAGSFVCIGVDLLLAFGLISPWTMPEVYPLLLHRLNTPLLLLGIALSILLVGLSGFAFYKTVKRGT